MSVRIVSSAALVLAAFSLLASVWLFTGLRDEGEQRRDQTCVILEGQQKLEVDQLKRTYDYLAGLTPKQRHEPINRAVLAQLPQTETVAKADNAPPYCDEPGLRAERRGARPVGLPEPDPIIPCRPLNIGLPKIPCPPPALTPRLK